MVLPLLWQVLISALGVVSQWLSHDLIICDLLNLGARENVAVVGERRAAVTGVGEVGDGRSDSVHESKGNDVNLAVIAVVAQALLSKVAAALTQGVLAPVDRDTLG